MTWGSDPTHQELREAKVNVRQQFLENMSQAAVANKDAIISAAIQAYCPDALFIRKGDLECKTYLNGDELWSYQGDAIIRFKAPTFSWQQQVDQMNFSMSQEYQIQFDIEDVPNG